MNPSTFDYKPQLLRELRTRWRLRQRGNTALGTAVTLACFYVLHWPGYSQVYDVVLPYVYAAFHLALLAFTQLQPERKGATAAFHVNLPRSRATRFDANALFFLAHAVYFELVIAVGIYVKLGGAGITPIYRVAPDVALLPMVAVLATLWFCHREPGWTAPLQFTALFVAAIACLAVIRCFYGPAGPENNFLPPRLLPLVLSSAIGAGVLVGSGALCWRVRDRHIVLRGEKP